MKMRKWAVAAAIFAASAFADAQAAQPQAAQSPPVPSQAASPALATPGIDAQAFAPGAIRRFDERHEAWTLRCEEIARLRERFCDLSAEGDGRGFRVSLVVTTSDRGEPAALLRLPLGVLLTSPIEISTPNSAPAPKAGPHEGKRRKARVKPHAARAQLNAASSHITRLRVLACDQAGCSTVWPLTRAQMEALSRGEDLQVNFAAMKPVAVRGSLDPWSQTVPLKVTISGKGFAAAVRASTDTPARRGSWTASPPLGYARKVIVR